MVKSHLHTQESNRDLEKACESLINYLLQIHHRINSEYNLRTLKMFKFIFFSYALRLLYFSVQQIQLFNKYACFSYRKNQQFATVYQNFIIPYFK
jgi:hypothetical protein